MLAGLGAVGLGLVCVLVILLVPRKAKQMTPEERATIYTDRLVGRHADSKRSEPDRRSPRPRTPRRRSCTANKSLEDRIAKSLDGAGSSWRPSEWLLLHSAIFIGRPAWWASCSARAACSSA